MDKKSIAIIGGGIGGLVAGYELVKKGHKVTIFEKEKEIGGLLADFEMSGSRLEKAYHHIFKTDKEIVDLIKKLGLQGKLKWYKSSIGLYYDKKLYPFTTPLDLLKFKPLKITDKLRLGLIKLYLQKTKNWKKLADFTAKEWIEKKCGKRAYKIIWEPLLKGKFHRFYDKISMAWLWARVHVRTETLGYLEGGFGQIINKLSKNLEIKTLCSASGRTISLDRAISNFDIVIDTRPIEGVNYLGAITLVFSTKQSLSKYYWHNINDLESPFLAFIQHTNLVDKKNYQNNNIYYLGTYVPQDHKYFSYKDSLIYREFFDYLKKIFPNFDENLVKEKKVFKFKYAQHIVAPSYKVPNYKVKDNLYRLNFAQIYPEDRGINFAVKEARRLVSSI